MPKLRIRKVRKLTAPRPVPVPVPSANASPQAAAPASSGHAPPMSLAELSVRLGAQQVRQRQLKEQAEAEAAREAAARQTVSESSASTDYITPVSSQEQDPGAEVPSPTQRGPLQPSTYFQQLFDAKTPYFDGPHIPKALRERDPWVAREPPPKPQSSSFSSSQQLRRQQRHRPVRGPKKSPFKKPPKPCLTLCKSPQSCTHSYCYYHNLHEKESASSSS